MQAEELKQEIKALMGLPENKTCTLADQVLNIDITPDTAVFVVAEHLQTRRAEYASTNSRSGADLIRINE